MENSAHANDFEAAKNRLAEIAEAVEDESISLDEALDLYEEAVAIGLRASDLLEVGVAEPEESGQGEKAGAGEPEGAQQAAASHEPAAPAVTAGGPTSATPAVTAGAPTSATSAAAPADADGSARSTDSRSGGEATD